METDPVKIVEDKEVNSSMIQTEPPIAETKRLEEPTPLVLPSLQKLHDQIPKPPKQEPMPVLDMPIP
jgi:hypothetical protein